MLSKFITRSFQDGDENQVVELLHKVFPSGPWSDRPSHLDYYRWKYLESPFKTYCIAIAESNGIIIGTAHDMLYKIHLSNKTWLSGIGADASVHPDYRKMGVFGALRAELIKQQKNKGVYFHTAISSNPILIDRNIRKGNLRFPLDVVELVRHKNTLKQIRETRSLNSRYFSNKIKSINSYEARPDSIEVKQVDSFDDSFDKFSDRIVSLYDYIVVRDSSYLSWRYCDNRGGSYVVFSASEEGELVGFIVLRNFQSYGAYPKSGGYIVDLVSLPGRVDVCEVLVSSGLDWLDSVGVDSVRWWGLKGCVVYGVLINGGFSVSQDLNLFYNNPRDIESFHLIKKISLDYSHLAFGDHDHI